MDYKDYLDTTVLQEKKPVTYRSLARSLNIHVNVAKQALYQYSLAQQSTVSTIYCLTGTSIDNTFSIRLVNEDDLEETKKEYRQLSGVHVYSVLPCKPKDLSVLVTVHKDMVALPLEDRVKNGLIWNNSVSTIKPGSKPTTTATPAPKPPSVPATTTPSKTPFGSSSTTTKKPAASTTPAKRKGTLSFEKATPKAKKQATEKKKSPSPPPASRKVKTIQVSEDEESEDEEALDARLARSAKIQANDFFSDDDDGDEKMANNTTEQKPDDSDDHSMKTASPVMESNEDIKIDDDTPLKEDQTKEDDDDEEEKEPTPGKIRRKVLKKKTYRNERGFLVTEDTFEWEEVDAETSAAPKKTPAPKPKAAPSPPAKKSAATKKAPGEQKSLLSFWGKR